MVSLPFLIVTLLIYVSLRELRNLHGKILICYVLVLISAFVSLPIIQLKIAELSKFFCKFCGYWFYFSILSCFFWLNVMCFDIWSNITGKIRRSRNYTAERRFVKYALYAFLSPALFLIVAIVMDNANVPDYLKPKVGRDFCYLNSK